MKKLILDELKGLKSAQAKRVLGTIKSIRIRHHSYLTIDTVNLFSDDEKFLEKLLAKFSCGSFDGQVDSYDWKPSSERHERAVMYINICNEFSDDIKEKVKDDLARKWKIVDDATAMEKSGYWYDQMVWKHCNQLKAA